MKVAQSCPPLCHLMDYTVHGILWDKNTGVGSLYLLQGIFPIQRLNQVSLITIGFFTSWATRKAQKEEVITKRENKLTKQIEKFSWFFHFWLLLWFMFQSFSKSSLFPSVFGVILESLFTDEFVVFVPNLGHARCFQSLIHCHFPNSVYLHWYSQPEHMSWIAFWLCNILMSTLSLIYYSSANFDLCLIMYYLSS